MTRTFLTITQEEIDAKLAENLHSRELELMSYDFERDNHEQAIAALSHLEWDETTAPYKNLPRDAMIVRALADNLDAPTIQKIADLNTLDKHKAELLAVAVETAKSERHYDSLLAALPEEKREAAFAVVKEKEAAQTAARLAK